MTYLRCRLP